MESKEVSKPVKDDCFSCRMIGGSSMLLCSIYVFAVAYRARTQMKKITSGLFGSSLGYVGIARFLDIFPFGQENMNNSALKQKG